MILDRVLMIYSMSATDLMTQNCLFKQPFQLLTSHAPCLLFLVSGSAYKAVLNLPLFLSLFFFPPLNRCLSYSVPFLFFTSLFYIFQFLSVDFKIQSLHINSNNWLISSLTSHLSQLSLFPNILEIFILFNVLNIWFVWLLNSFEPFISFYLIHFFTHFVEHQAVIRDIRHSSCLQRPHDLIREVNIETLAIFEVL